MDYLISCKKCPFVKRELQYMSNTIFIKGKKSCVKPMKTKIEVTQRLNPPTTPKGYKCFGRVINFLSLFCPGLQKLPKPISDFTRKGKGI